MGMGMNFFYRDRHGIAKHVLVLPRPVAIPNQRSLIQIIILNQNQHQTYEIFYHNIYIYIYYLSFLLQPSPTNINMISFYGNNIPIKSLESENWFDKNIS